MAIDAPNIKPLSSAVPSEVRDAFNALRDWFARAGKAGGVASAKDTAASANQVQALSDTLVGATPPQLTSFTVTGAFRTIMVQWADPGYSQFSYVELWRAGVDNLGVATLIGTTSANIYVDSPPNSSSTTTYYYWARGVNAAGITGPYNATAGTPGHTANDPAYVLEVLKGQLGYSEFGAGAYPVRVVSALPTLPNALYPASSLVYLSSDNKLYRQAAGVWTSAIPAADVSGQLADSQLAALSASKVTGQLTDAQVAALAAAKLTGQITATQITDGAISTPKLAAGSITTAKIAADAVTANEIAAGAVTATEIAAGAVTAGKIAAGAVSATEIAAGAVTAGKIAANAVTATELAANAITAGKIAAGAIVAGDGVIGNAAIASAQIIDAAITNAKIASLAVDSGKIADAAIGTAKIADASITTAKIVNLAVDTGKITDAAITNAKIGNLAVTNAKIADASITSAKIGDAEVGTLKIANNAVTVPVSAYTAASISCPTSDTTIQTVTIDSQGQPVALTCCAVITGGRTGTSQIGYTYYGVTVKVLRGATVLYSATIPSYDNTPIILPWSALLLDTAPPTGSNTYTMTVSGTSFAATAANRAMLALGVMR